MTDVDGNAMLRAVATDGHRLARLETPAPAGAAGMPGVIVPRKAVAEVQKLIEDPEADVTIELSATKIRFTLGAGRADLEADRRHLPRLRARHSGRTTTSCSPSSAAISPMAVDRVSTISSERGRAVKLAVADGKLMLSVTNPDSGSAIEELEVDYDAAPLEIGFNARYLLDIANQLDSDTALFKLNDAGSPTIIQDRDGASALYVLMPMRV